MCWVCGDSWQNWINAESETRDGEKIRIQDTYGKQGRSDVLFRKWLVSHGDESVLEQLDTPTGAGFGFNDENSVVLLGQGSLGKYGSAEGEVRGGLIQSLKDGTMAWWVGAENQKAAVQNPEVARNRVEDIRKGMDAISHMDASELEGLDKLSLKEGRYSTLCEHEDSCSCCGAGWRRT